MITNLGLSVLSQNEINSMIYQKSIPFEEALQYMTDELRVRTFAETLSAFNDKDDLKQKLINGLYEIDQSVNGKQSRDSVARNVRNWLGGAVVPDRKHLVRMCFALQLNERSARAFLSLTTEGGFHLRSPWELVLAFGLRTGKSYEECTRFYKYLKPLKTDIEPLTNIVFTRVISDLFELVTDDKSFLQFYEENSFALGVMHNTAYYKCFLPFMNMLICPEVPTYLESERRYSVEEVVEAYLRMNIPFEKETSKYALLQRTIRKYWPNASSITRMRNRTEDVSRKVILLLYLVTGGHCTSNTERKTQEEDLLENEQFENHYWKLNSMLDDCGFSLLDPRRVFDWLVLFCLKVDGDELVSERLQEMLSIIFQTEIT